MNIPGIHPALLTDRRKVLPETYFAIMRGRRGNPDGSVQCQFPVAPAHTPTILGKKLSHRAVRWESLLSRQVVGFRPGHLTRAVRRLPCHIKYGYCTSRSSTSKTSVASGGMMPPPAPRSP